MNEITTTVVIPNYNGMAFLPTCMESLKRQTYKGFRVVVIDNASKDAGVEWLKANCPEVQLVVNDTNLGFSGAVNQGIEMAETPFVILLNNDVECDPEYVGAMVEAISRSEDIFSVSARMIRFSERDTMDDGGDLYNLLGWGFQRGTGLPAEDYSADGVKLFSACAGAAIYRKSIFDEIGLFDLNHFAYLEDIDVGYRARINGYRNIYCSKAIVYHVGSGTSADGNKYSDFKVKLAARNNIYLIYKNMPALQRFVNAPWLWLGNVLKQKFFDRKGFGEAYRQGIAEGRSTRKDKCRRVPFRMKNFGHYCAIQWELFANLFVYTREYLRRKKVHT